jgi:tetratricopeptide (TPR) repeat protein
MTRRHAAALVVLALLAAYAAAPWTAFQYDDFRVVVIERDVHSWPAFVASMPGLRPLTKASYVVNWTWSQAPAGFALMGVALHVAASLLVLALARRWLAAMAPACPRPEFASLVCALLFALHPAQTEAVVYIAGRSTVLSGAATLAGLYAWERARDGASRAWMAGVILCLAAALAAREAAWTLPLALLLVECARGARLRDAFKATAPVWIAFAVVVATVMAVTANRQLLASSLAIRGPLDNLLAQVDAVAYLVTHPFFTLRLNFDPPLVPRTALDVEGVVLLAAIAATLLAGFVQLRRRPWLGFGILWLALALLPTHGPLARLELANDRQLYLALVGPGLIVGVMLGTWSRRGAAALATAMLALALGLATFVRVTDYASETRLWTATVRASPANPRAWNNLGHALEQDGDFVGARAAYERALTLDPAHRKARGNLDALPRP